MHIVGESIDAGSMQTDIMVATNEYLVTIWQIAEPIKEIQCFSLFSDHTEISGMDHNISRRQFSQPMMRSVGIREM